MRKIVKKVSIGLSVLCCGLAVAGAGDANWPLPHMTDLPADYLERQHACIAAASEHLDKPAKKAKAGKEATDDNQSIGWVRSGFNALLLNARADEVNRFFESDKFIVTANPKFGFSLFSLSYMRLYGTMNSRTGIVKGRLSPGAQANFEKGFWAVAKANSKLAEARTGVWEVEGSENHHLSSKSSDFLVAQYLRNIPAYANLKYDDGSTLAEQYEARRAYFLKWFDEHAKRGQFTEAGSPSYQSDSIAALFNIRDFAEDPLLRKKADMYLDLTYANIAEETLLTVRGGPKSRCKVGHEYDGGMSDRSYDALFGSPGRTFDARGSNPCATSDYYPSPAIVSLAKDTTTRGTYTFSKRWPGPIAADGGRGLANVDAEGESLWRKLDAEKSILRYGFASPGYVIGSAGVDPTWVEDATSGHRWQGIVFANDPLSRIGFEGQAVGDATWHAFNSFISVQDRNVLVTEAWNPVPPNPKSSEPAVLRVYFSPTLDDVQDDGGWIFVKAGSSFAAVKPLEAYSWTPAWQHSDSLKDKAFITLSSKASPVITIANQASDYKNDFNAFKAACKTQPIRYSNGVVQFATITFAGTRQPATIGGQAVNLAPALGYDSPFIRSTWNSGLIYIRKRGETEILDFRDPNNPIKTLGAPITEEFPPGVGSTAPIIFGKM